MGIIVNGQHIKQIYTKGSEVKRIYDHGRLVYESSIPDYLCFTALEAGTFTLTVPAAVTPTYLSYVEWSKDGRTWNHTDNTSEAVTIDVQVAQGDKVYWRGSGGSLGPSYLESNRSKFSSSADFDVSGHIMSLLVGDNFGSFEYLTHVNTNGIRNATFSYLFKDCTTLVNAKDLVLPTFEAYYQYIFTGLFHGCTSLATQPPLPSTTLAQHCYNSMFYKCTALPESATLPATTLAASCYRYMYYGCSNLQTVNPILATTAVGTDCMNQMFRICWNITRVELHLTGALTQSCCYQMFRSCSALSYVKCLATDISATNCVTNWLDGVNATGTFIQAAGVTWPRGASGIPTGWLAYDEGEEIPNDYAACDYIHITKGSGMVADVLADKSTYGCELEYNFTQNELDAAANNNTYIPLMYYSKAVTTDPDFPKQICGQLYLRYNADWLGWQRNAGIYTRPTTGEKTTNSSAIVMKRPAVTGWHYIRCAATTTDDNFICLFDDEITQAGKNYYPLMNENPTDEPAEIYISCRNNAAAYPIDNGGDMKYFKIIHPDGETIVADYVPCVRKSDNVAGFWDKVGLVFKSSFRTPFVAGYNQT